MTESLSIMDLSILGSELDAARRQRQPLSTSPASPKVSEAEARPYPLCLLCLTRPPTAVLLPCAHLNLCHLCAPLLILKTCPPSPLVAIPASTHDDGRIPYNLLLRKACASNPKMAKLAGGGHIAPQLGRKGGEFRGRDLVPSLQVSPTDCEEADDGKVLGTKAKVEERNRGFSIRRDGQGRIGLEGCEDDDGFVGGNARCLVCRAGVSGWLRVYTG